LANRVAYLINQYPKLSHTFIRREILALEQLGLEVVRIAVRKHDTGEVDAADAAEADKTRYILGAPRAEILSACARALARSPKLFRETLATAIALGRQSDGVTVKHLAYLAEACVLYEWLAEAKVSHVHAHFGTNAATVAMLCRLLGGPTYSFTVHGPEEFDRARALALREKVGGASFVAAISSFCRSQLYRWSASVDWDKIQIVRCAIDSSYFSERAASTSITAKPRLVCVGRLSEEKGQMLVVRAAALLRRQGLDLQVDLVGDGPLRPELEREIDANGLRDVVRLAGWLDNEQVRALMLESRALVLSSFAEGLPVVIMEAFALGRPVISTMIAGIPELVEHRVNGWLVPSGSLEELASAMREVITAEPARLETMGEEGRRRVRERHSSDVEAAKLRELFVAAINASSTV